MTRLDESDRILANRYVDGELKDGAVAQFEQRLLQDAALRACVDELRGLRALFAPGRDERPPVPVGFAAAVLTQVRRLPSRAELLAEPGERGEVEQIEQSVARLGRRLLAAAALIFAVALLIVSGLLRPVGADRMEASKDEVRKLIEQIQAREGADALGIRGR